MHSSSASSVPGLTSRRASPAIYGCRRGSWNERCFTWVVSWTSFFFRDPVEVVLRKLANPDGGAGKEPAESKTGVHQGITVEEPSAKWQETVVELRERGTTVTNAKNALEGALSIRCSGLRVRISEGRRTDCLVPGVDIVFLFCSRLGKGVINSSTLHIVSKAF